jgi:hypothetical protein
LDDQPNGGNTTEPIIIDLGKKARKKVKRLRKGRGSLMGKVEETIEALKAQGQIDPKSQPVVVVVRERRRNRRLSPWG